MRPFRHQNSQVGVRFVIITNQTKSHPKPDCLIADLKVKLSANGDIKNKRSCIQLPIQLPSDKSRSIADDNGNNLD